MDSPQARADQAGNVRPGEELELAVLEPYLRSRLPGATGALAVEQFPRGHSNLTYLVRFGQQEFVLRRPPFGNPVKSAHDMGREYRVLSKLCDVYEPAPRPLLFCDDADVIGDEFYVMERRIGIILRSDAPPVELASNPDRVRQLCEALVDNLVELHTLDYRAAGLADLGRPEGYIGRQVDGWSKRYLRAKTDELPEVKRLAQWLADNQPADGAPGLIHNDYKYDNLMLAEHDLSQVVAVLDWEMATVGDPLMDLGMTLAYWVEPGDPEMLRQTAFGPTMLEGSYTRRQIVDRYAKVAQRDLPEMLFYYCFGLIQARRDHPADLCTICTWKYERSPFRQVESSRRGTWPGGRKGHRIRLAMKCWDNYDASILAAR